VNFLATLILLYFALRQIAAVRAEPAAVGWVVIGYAVAASLLIPLVAVWL
jgi:hypothetical protein